MSGPPLGGLDLWFGFGFDPLVLVGKWVSHPYPLGNHVWNTTKPLGSKPCISLLDTSCVRFHAEAPLFYEQLAPDPKTGKKAPVFSPVCFLFEFYLVWGATGSWKVLGRFWASLWGYSTSWAYVASLWMVFKGNKEDCTSFRAQRSPLFGSRHDSYGVHSTFQSATRFTFWESKTGACLTLDPVKFNRRNGRSTSSILPGAAFRASVHHRLLRGRTGLRFSDGKGKTHMSHDVWRQRCLETKDVWRQRCQGTKMFGDKDVCLIISEAGLFPIHWE